MATKHRPAFGLSSENLEIDPETETRAHALLELLAEETGASLGLRPIHGYRDLGEALDDGRVDFAWLPPVPAIRGIWMGRLRPVAVPVRQGRTDFFAVLFVRRDARAATMNDLAGQRVGWVDRSSASGYTVPRERLLALGEPPDRLFRSQVCLGSHIDVVRAVRNGLVDVGATYAQFGPHGRLLELAGREARDDLRVILAAGPIPNEVIVASSRVPHPLVQRVEDALTSAPSESQVARAATQVFRCERLVAVTDGHLQALGDLMDGAHTARPPRDAHA